MRVQFIGCGDAFGSGGRFNTCFHVDGVGGKFLIDCGASSLISMKQLAIERNAIDVILLTHFHPDHLAAAVFHSRRTTYRKAKTTADDRWSARAAPLV